MMAQRRHRELITHPTPQGGYFILTTDGAIEPKKGTRPREASIGVVLRTPKGGLLAAISKRLREAKDPPEAEYKAFIQGLELARRHRIGRLRVFLDSALVVNQLRGVAKVKAEHLERLHRRAKRLLDGADIEVSWIPRSWNTEADLLAAKALEPIRRGTRS
jgi:ribonuclease HI